MPNLTSIMTRDEIQKQKLALDFLKGKTKDHKGRTVEDYMNLSETEMELDHEWVQWAFPIDTVSPHNPHAGLLFYGCAGHFKQDSKADVAQRKLTQKYLQTIGITNFHNKYAFDVKCDAGKFFQVVDSPANHHIKRISRVLRHLTLTNNDHAAKGLLRSITRDLIAVNPSNFSSWTVAYWNAIVYNYLHVFPRN